MDGNNSNGQNTHHQVVVIGGGTGGIMVSAQLLRARKDLDVAIIEPSEIHAYQPAWTLVGAGLMKKSATERKEANFIPKKAKWIKDYVEDIDPDAMTVTLRGGNKISYEYLIVAPGIQINLDGIEGLEEAYKKDNVCSNYVDPDKTWDIIRNFKGGIALFTQPASPIKCPGAPQKIMYLAADHFSRNGVKEATVGFATPGTVIFGTEPFRTELEKYLKKYDISQRYGYKLVKIDGEKNEAYYERVALPDGRTDYVHNDENNEMGDKEVDGYHVIKYDMMHLAPPQSAPSWFQKTKLANPDGANKGWMGVDENTLQSKYYENVFGVGDITDLPTARTGAAIRKQAPVIVDNILKIMDGEKADNHDYDGYSSCPLVVAHNRMVLAEFKYGGVRSSDPTLSKLVDTGKASYSMWLMKRYGLPFLYWNAMLKGYQF